MGPDTGFFTRSIKVRMGNRLRKRTVALIRSYTGTSSSVVLARRNNVYQADSCSSTIMMVVATSSDL